MRRKLKREAETSGEEGSRVFLVVKTGLTDRIERTIRRPTKKIRQSQGTHEMAQTIAKVTIRGPRVCLVYVRLLVLADIR